MSNLLSNETESQNSVSICFIQKLKILDKLQLFYNIFDFNLTENRRVL